MGFMDRQGTADAAADVKAADRSTELPRETGESDLGLSPAELAAKAGRSSNLPRPETSLALANPDLPLTMAGDAPGTVEPASPGLSRPANGELRSPVRRECVGPARDQSPALRLFRSLRIGSSFAEQSDSPGDGAGEAPAITVSHLLGEITWLLTQSPLHRTLQIGDLEWLVMPALVYRQLYIFREGDRPVGLALWAKCNAEAEAKLDRGMIEPENRLTTEEWQSGDAIWLVDLVAPFADAANQHREIMIGDLITGPLANQAFKFHQTDPTTGVRTVRTVEADAGEKLREAVEAATGKSN